jgi:hypothetical protein
MTPVIGSAKTERLIKTVLMLETVTDIRTLARFCSGPEHQGACFVFGKAIATMPSSGRNAHAR